MAEERANLSNWRKPPFSHWAFRNIDKFLRTAPIEASKVNAQELPSAPLSFDEIKVSTQDGTSLSLEGYLKETATDGFLVLKDGRIVYEYYDHDNTSSSLHIIMSVTKSVVGLLLGILCDKGDVDVDNNVASYMPEMASTAYHDATIRDLIDMRTGVKAEMWDPGYRAAMGWEPRGDKPEKVPEGLLEYFETLKVGSDPHGGPFKYCSQNTDLLGLIIERATGKSLPSLLSELLWKPLGAQSDALMNVDQKGASRAAGGMCTTLQDLARIGQLIVDDGRSGSKQVVSHSWLEDIFTKGDPQAWEQGAFAAAMKIPGREMSYRSGWYISKGHAEWVSAMGLHGQQLMINRKDRLVIAKTASQVQAIDPKLLVLIYPIIGQIRRITSQD